jgi:choline dehydrogenase-like flavoprotein
MPLTSPAFPPRRRAPAARDDMARWLVVGGGAAGCVVASRLSERTEDEIVLIEAGRDHPPAPPAADVGPYLSDPERIWYEHVVRSGGSTPQEYVQGRGLGGSSLVNGGVVVGVDPGGHALPLELPTAHGPVSQALLDADADARPVRLVRRDGARVSAADAYLDASLRSSRANLHVVTERAVGRVRVDRGRAVGVELADGSSVDGDRVVMCAGAIRTPWLLLRSGIRTPGLGEHIQDHPAVTLTLRPSRKVPGTFRDGAPTISVAADHGEHLLMAIEALPHGPRWAALVVSLTAPRSEGRVSIGEDGAPVVDLGQLARPEDRRRLAIGIGRALDLLGSGPFAGVVAEAFVDAEGTPVSHLTEDRDRIEPWLVAHPGGHYHAAGSCRDGVSCDEGVLRGADGIFVADASALPGVPRLDPYLAVVTQAERFVAAW